MHNISFETLLNLVPTAPNFSPNWAGIWALWPKDMAAMDECPQDPIHHAEGDVGLHTRMVAESLIALPEWRVLGDNDRSILFWAAVLHDIGKPATTEIQPDGRVSARGHARISTLMARRRLWLADAPFAWREAVCNIAAEHLVPFWLIEKPDPRRVAIMTSWRGRADFLCLHAKADTLGRICADQNAVLDNIALARESFAEYDCLSQPFRFANDASRLSYFEKEARDPNYAEHADFRCSVTLMSGLPGAGKDSWINQNLPDIPMISLDSIRAEIGASSTGNQGVVLQAARERAREYLRAGQDFVWNATNISRTLRAKPLKLFRDYNARTEIVYIEAGPDKLFSQNKNRDDIVPLAAMENLIRKLEPPGEWEAHKVSYVVK